MQYLVVAAVLHTILLHQPQTPKTLNNGHIASRSPAVAALRLSSPSRAARVQALVLLPGRRALVFGGFRV